MIDKEQELKSEEHTNNYCVPDWSTVHWTSIEMMENYFKLTPYRKEDILMNFRNTIKNGYTLIKQSEIDLLKEEIAYLYRTIQSQ